MKTAPASFAQERLWLLDRLEPGNVAYNMRVAYRVDGPLDLEVLAQCLREIAGRHETLRTTIRGTDEGAVQHIDPDADAPVGCVDLSEIESARRSAALSEAMTAEVRRPFDLERGPLFRVSVFVLAEDEHALLFTMHHIVSDGWSMGVLLDELLALYEEHTTGSPAALEALPLQYSDHARRQRERFEAGAMRTQLSYWIEELAGAPAVLELPRDRPRPRVPSSAGDEGLATLPAGLARELERLGRESGATLFMTLLAGLSALAHVLTGETDIVIGSPVAGRNEADVEGLIGFFVNVLVLRLRLDGDPTARELLRRARDKALKAYDNQDVPFEKLVEELQPVRDPSRTPVFQVMFVFQNAPMPDLERAGLSLRPLEVASGTARYDLCLYGWREADGSIGLRWESNRDVFLAATVERMAALFARILRGFVDAPDGRLGALPLASDADRAWLAAVNATRRPVPANTVHGLFELQVERTPDRTALVDGETRVTYLELEERSNRLAQTLASHGVGCGDVVAVCLERSIASCVALLAVLKAGAAHLALDPAHPRRRIARLIESARPRAVIGDGEHAELLAGVSAPRILIDADREEVAVGVRPRVRVSDPAWIVFTSGSTGEPKGVVGTHENLVNRCAWMWERFPFGDDEVGCHKTSPAFVDSLWELFGPLLRGVPVLVVNDARARKPDLLAREVEVHRVTRLTVVPAMLAELLAARERLGFAFASLRFVSSSGETLPIELCRRFSKELPHASLLNLYGSTEVSADVTAFDTAELSGDNASVPLGRPISNATVHVLDRRMRPVPIGVPGELWVGGRVLTHGYLHDPEATAASFLPDPSGPPGARLYRTGDRARFLGDGNLELHGRIDQQVQVMGQRVEPAEVEAALCRSARVGEAAVVPAKDEAGAVRLVAYVAPLDASAGDAVDELRRHAAEELPAAMVPASFVFLDALPRTTSGKVDRSRLPAPGTGRPRSEPRTEMEKAVAELWREVLPSAEPGVHDNFYDVGGHSLLAVQVVDRIRTRLGVEVRGDALLLQSLGQLARNLEGERPGRRRRPEHARTVWPGLAWIAAGLVWNPWTLSHGRFVDGHADRALWEVLLFFDAFCIALGLFLLWRRPRRVSLSARAALGVPLVLFTLGAYYTAPALLPHSGGHDLARSDRAERVQEHVSDRLRGLGVAVSNLRLPGPESLAAFASSCSVNDLLPGAGSREEGRPLDLDHSSIRVRDWGVSGAASPVAGPLDLWRAFFDQVDYFEHASFKSLRTDFLGSGEERCATPLRFTGLARLREGPFVQVRAEIAAEWQRSPSDTESWHIARFELASFRTIESESLLFEEVLDRIVPDRPTHRRLHLSAHEEYVREYLLSGGARSPRRDFTIVSSGQHPGVSVADVDADGLDDVYVMPRWGRNLFLRQLEDGSFVEEAAARGLDIADYTTSAVFADYDNDGDADAFVGRAPPQALYLVNEEGVFADRTAERVTGKLPRFVTSLSAADYDGDGLLDVYLSTYAVRHLLTATQTSRSRRLANLVGDGALLRGELSDEDARELYRRFGEPGFDPVLNLPGPPNVLLHNLGDGRFERAAESPAVAAWRNTFQATWGDYDDDGDPDLYLANDFAPNHMFRNDGADGFADATTETGTADIGFGMGVSFGDYDNDGRQDLYVTNMDTSAGSRIVDQVGGAARDLAPGTRGNSLFRNTGAAFDKVSGKGDVRIEVEEAGWSWAGQFADFDNDGYLDIYALSGNYSAPDPVAQAEDT